MKLFHSQARYTKKKNFIAKLTNDRQMVTSNEDKAYLLLDFYSNLIDTREEWHNPLDSDALGIQHHDLHMMDAPILEEEVWNTIKLLPSDKALSLNGFNDRFYKVCWPTIKEDIMVAVSAIWRRAFRNFRLLNTTYITLLPKIEEANHPKDYRPISLIHSFTKLITKILANRLAARLEEMVSTNQSVFIKGRFVQDNFMLVQQTTRFLHSQKQA
jgi:hypothetical protein